MVHAVPERTMVHAVQERTMVHMRGLAAACVAESIKIPDSETGG